MLNEFASDHPAANTAAVVVLPEGGPWLIEHLHVGYGGSGALTAADLTIVADNADYQLPISAKGAAPLELNGRFTGTTTITLPAGGANVEGHLNVFYRRA